MQKSMYCMCQSKPEALDDVAVYLPVKHNRYSNESDQGSACQLIAIPAHRHQGA